MKTIRSKLILYFFFFVLLFNIVATTIYFSSHRLMNEYHTSIERFLVLNTISQTSNELYDTVNAYVVEKTAPHLTRYYDVRQKLMEDKEQLREKVTHLDPIQLNQYIHIIDTLLQESELTVGFVLKHDIERYTEHVKETRQTANYIQETTLHLIDMELTEYQDFYQQLQQRHEHFKWFIISLFGTTVLLGIFFAVWFSRSMNKPIQTLSNAAQEVASGVLEGPDIKIKSNDELKLLGTTFNDMRKNIRNLIEEMKEKSELDRLLKELELKHLQNQINPHFLFNTLNTISRMAYLENARNTSKLIEAVSVLLRHSLGDLRKSVTLKDEVEVVHEYLYIQSTRFADRMKFTKRIETDNLTIPIPRLTLQPLVENAFIHGIEGKEDGGVIGLHIFEEKEKVVVEIEDNGVGMSEELIDKFQNIQNDDDHDDHVGHSTGLGLRNVIRRLQLFYQEENVVEIDSQLYRGTTIRLRLPKTIEEVDK
ncbi:sensor histidine kinase [Salirhabdus salicampi]|uniref:sensor histidine kinase n=1 Tax=Salirhabdus salicampi TaxID=476102 RepID=UPI0020C1B9B1|nr:sensor histidine kinase [Salirhabdus salicampi]MCP8617560.1 sensor histidine kinase [Salirhabdus salicampi]